MESDWMRATRIALEVRHRTGKHIVIRGLSAQEIARILLDHYDWVLEPEEERILNEILAKPKKKKTRLRRKRQGGAWRRRSSSRLPASSTRR